MAPTEETWAETFKLVVPSPPWTTGWKNCTGGPLVRSVTATMSESFGTTGTDGNVTPATLLMLAVRVGTALGGPAFIAAFEALPAAGALALERVPRVLQLMPSALP